jgi:hypothetical protein
MKNKLTDLNNHLFAQIERLGDEKLTGDKLKQELERSKAVSSIAKDIVANGALTLKVLQAIWERDVDVKNVPVMLQNSPAVEG